MLTMIKNGSRASKEAVILPYSKVKHAIAICLEKEGYLNSVSKKTTKNFYNLVLGINYIDSKPKITDLDRISKPSKRVYVKAKDIKSVKNNYGLVVLSTPKGILSGKDARKEQVGGEVLFKIW